jgi:hypothetical protein
MMNKTNLSDLDAADNGRERSDRLEPLFACRFVLHPKSPYLPRSKAVLP